MTKILLVNLRWRFVLAIIPCLSWLFATSVSAQTTRDWLGLYSNDWYNPNNWDPVGVPAYDDTVNIVNGSINLSLPVTFGGQIYFEGGTLSGFPLTIAGGGLLNISGGVEFDNILTNSGTVNWLSGVVHIGGCANGGPLVNLAGGVWNIECDQAMGNSCNSGEPNLYFQNFGTLEKTAGTGTTMFSMPFYSMSGNINVQNGLINCPQGGSFNGTCNVATNSSVELGGDFYSGGALIAGDGTVQFSNGSLTLSNTWIDGLQFGADSEEFLGTNFENGAITNLTLPAGTMLGSALNIASNGVLNLCGGVLFASAVTNAGTVNWLSGAVFVDGCAGAGPIINLPGAVWNIECDQVIGNNCDSGEANLYFQNFGTLEKTANTGTTSFSLYYENEGQLMAQSGLIDFRNGFENDGIMDFELSSLNNYGQIAFTGQAPLSGDLAVNLANGYLPDLGTSFQLMFYNDENGSFATTNLPSSFLWQLDYGANAFTVTPVDLAGPLPGTYTFATQQAVNGLFIASLEGLSSGQTVVIQTSTNLANWSAIQTNIVMGTSLSITNPISANIQASFLRAVIQ